MKALAGALILVGALAPVRALAAPEACAQAYERAQERRLDGELRAAREQLLACVPASCPAFIRNDCTRWLAEVDAAQPTVVFAARAAGRDTDAVAVTCNDLRVAERLDGRPLPLDPGKQRCRFESGGTAVTRELVIVEGQKNRLVEVELVGIAPAPSPAPVRARPSLTPAIALAGVAVLGVGGFIALGASGLHGERHLRDTCAPACPAADVRSVRLRYNLADASLAVGLLAAAASYFTLRAHGVHEVSVAAGPGAVAVGGSF